MAITRSQQARQMLKTAGAVEQDGFLNYIKNSESVTVPKEFKARKGAPATKLAYITAAEAKMLKKKKPGTPHKGPKGIPSYDSFDADMNFTSGAAMSAAERGGGSGADRKELDAYIDYGSDTKLPPGVTRELPQDIKDLRLAAIAAGAGQRVNPGFFDSRDRISPTDLKLAKQFAPKAFARTRGGGIMNFITGGGFLENLVRGLGQRFGLGKRFDQPTYDMSRFSGLPLGGSAAFANLDIRDKFNRLDDDEKVSQSDFEYLGPNFNEGIYMDYQELDDAYNNVGSKINSGTITPLEDDFKSLVTPTIIEPALADGGRIGANEGGIMGGLADGQLDDMGRQMYGLGKLVKKITGGIKKIAKSPIGKAALFAAPFAFNPGTGATLGSFFGKGSFNPFKAVTLSGGSRGLLPQTALSGLGKLLTNIPGISTTSLLSGASGVGAGILGTSILAGLLTPAQKKQAQLIADETGIDIQEIEANPEKYLATRFMAEGGDVEPVAKKTMPLLDMDGKEMDLRQEGGFVPIGRMERADDVPARLSKNEFVFTADAVRNAGEGDIDKGAEVMYNMMKNLEAGGDVSEESQGIEGARKMFQTSQRLEEVL